jgi:hypothetical protein
MSKTAGNSKTALMPNKQERPVTAGTQTTERSSEMLISARILKTIGTPA